MKRSILSLIATIVAGFLFFAGCQNNAGQEIIVYQIKEIIREVPVEPELNTNIGKIYYSDGTYDRSYIAEKNPVGIVCNIDELGRPSLIIALDDSESPRSRDDIVTYKNEYALPYDGFGAGTWYEPALVDMSLVYTYKNYIMEGIKTLIEGGYTGRIYNLRMGVYATNSKVPNMSGEYYWKFDLESGTVSSGDTYSNHVRLLHKITYSD